LLALLPVLLAFGEQPYAGLTAAEAERLSTEASASFPRAYFSYTEHPRKAEPIETLRSTNSSGDAAWLTIFRFVGEDDPDQACVWVWKTQLDPVPYEFEWAPTVANGWVGLVHDRCAEIVLSRGHMDPEQTAGVDMPRLRIAQPEAVSPFGKVPRYEFLEDWWEPDLVLGGEDGLLVPATAPGTWGLTGFLLDESGESFESVPFATIALAPATPGALLSTAPEPPPFAVTTVTDEFGAFAFVNMPPIERGYVAYVSAPGYAPYVEDWGGSAGADMFVGDLALRRPGDLPG
jgi:hypothetical protein